MNNWGETARNRLKESGLIYFSDFLSNADGRLEKLNEKSRKVFSVCCADRLMALHCKLPGEKQRAFTLSWKPILKLIRNDLASEPIPATKAQVEEALSRYYASPYCHDLGQDGPDDSNEDAAAAAIMAAECFCNGQPEPASEIAQRIIDQAFFAVDDLIEKDVLDENDFVFECGHPLVQAEITWLDQIIKKLESNGSDIQAIRDILT